MRFTRFAPSAGALGRGIALIVLMSLGTGTTVASAPRTVSAAAGTNRPSIVLVLTDDQRWDTLWSMPHVRHILGDHGVTFRNGFVVNSVCCPSRSAILTGMYSHSTGVYTLSPPDGGFGAFDDRSTVATWLHARGYATGLFGKYLNGYGGTYIPPGWDRFFAFQQQRHGYYYDYRVNDQRSLRSFGDAPRDYSTNVIASKTASFIRHTKGPIFAYVAPFAPHLPSTPAPGDGSRFGSLRPYRPPSYDEADVSDKPAWVRSLPRWSSNRSASFDDIRKDQYRSLLAVDRMVLRIRNALADSGRLHNTLFVFTSDNGFSWGEHRWVNRKEAAYEEDIRVPLVIRYDPMGSSARVDRHMALNIDFAPTFAAAASVDAPGAEGRNLLPLLSRTAHTWRRSFLIEHERLVGQSQDPDTFCAVRSRRYLHVEYMGGAEELYDLNADPYEIANMVHRRSLRSTLDHLRRRLRVLCHPAPPGMKLPT